MSYRKDQGRFARMIAFWALTLLVAYGCFHGSGLDTVLDQNVFPAGSNTVLYDEFPIFDKLRISTLIALGVLLVCVVVFYRLLARPRIADALIETEEEMRKVTWPTWAETLTGSIAVAATVLTTLVFIFCVDLLVLNLVKALLTL